MAHLAADRLEVVAQAEHEAGTVLELAMRFDRIDPLQQLSRVAPLDTEARLQVGGRVAQDAAQAVATARETVEPERFAQHRRPGGLRRTNERAKCHASPQPVAGRQVDMAAACDERCNEGQDLVVGERRQGHGDIGEGREARRHVAAILHKLAHQVMRRPGACAPARRGWIYGGFEVIVDARRSRGLVS